jgi:tRNA-specific 2-thiouridylase
MKKKILVGMSGGVDSSVTAFLLKEQGYEVEGLSFVLWEARDRTDFSTCCSLQAIRDASKISEIIGVRHTQLDVRDVFVEKVIEPFVEWYTRGLTPNPCVLCNQYIKFPYLLRVAKERGFDLIATGHYARVVSDHRLYAQDGWGTGEDMPFTRRFLLLKGVSLKKDQSYFLYVLSMEQLERLVLPLGHFSKDEVRKIAKEGGLFLAEKPESQEICFIEGKNYFKFIDKLSPIAHDEGPIIDTGGNVIGTHRGIFAYTVGQRKGIGIASKEPLYVINIDHVKNAVYVGPKDMASRQSFEVGSLNWLVPAIPREFAASVKVRSTMTGEPARMTLAGDMVRVVYDKPQWAPAPGQSAVFYHDEVVIGGGIIV